MPDLTISQMTQVIPKQNFLVPVVDMTAPVGRKNVSIPLSDIWGGVNVTFGSGPPTAPVTAPMLYVDVTGAKGQILYANQTGASWLAIA